MFLDIPPRRNNPGPPGLPPGGAGRLMVPSHYQTGKPDIGHVGRAPTPQEQEAMRETQAQIMSVAMAIIARFGGVDLAPPGTGVMMEGLKRLEAWVRTQSCPACFANLGSVFDGQAEACPECAIPKECLVKAGMAAQEPPRTDPETQGSSEPEIGRYEPPPDETQPKP